MNFYKHVNVHLILNIVSVVRPPAPSVTVTNPLVDETHVTTLATCSSSGFRPGTINVTWLLEGGPTELMTDTTAVTAMTDDKFAVTTEYRRAVSKIDNGKTLTCTLNHETLDAPISTSVTLNISCNQTSFCYIWHVDIFVLNALFKHIFSKCFCIFFMKLVYT